MSLQAECAFIGCGQAGGNIVSLFVDDYNCLFINTSQEDLNTLRSAKRKYHIANADGASKDLENATRIIEKDYDNIVSQIDSVIKEKIVFVVGSLGGGSGNVLVRVISSYLSENYENEEDKRIVCPVLILPDEDTDSLVSCSNAREALKEIETLDVGAVFLLDNKKNPNKFAINHDFYNALDALLKMSNQSKDGNIDKSELKTCLGVKGVAMIGKLSKDKTNVANIVNSFNDNKVFAPIENDVVITYVGMSFSRPNIDINDVLKGYVIFDRFVGHGSSNTIYIISGMSYPLERISLISNKVKEGKKHLVNTFKKLNQSVFDDDDDEALSLSSIRSTKPVKKQSTRELLLAKRR